MIDKRKYKYSVKKYILDSFINIHECDSLLECLAKQAILSLTKGGCYIIYRVKDNGTEQLLTFHDAECKRYKWADWNPITRTIKVVDMETGEKYSITVNGLEKEDTL